MKSILLLFIALLISANLLAQSIQEFSPGLAHENHYFFMEIYGYKTHFQDADSNYICLYNDDDTLSFWMSLSYNNYSNAHFTYGFSSHNFPSAGTYHLKVYNTIDDTMYLDSAVHIFSHTGNTTYFNNEFPGRGQAGMQGVVKMNGSGNLHFTIASDHNGYFINRKNDTIRVDSFDILNPYTFNAYFNAPSHAVGLYNFIYSNSIDSLVIGSNDLLVMNSAKTQIEEITPDSIHNGNWYPWLIMIKGNKTHFTMDTNFIMFDEIINHEAILDSIKVLNDTTITLTIQLPIPVKKATFPNVLVRVYNETDGMMYYPIRVDLYGSIGESKEQFDNICIYPNPSSDIIHIQSEDFKGENQLNIQVLSIDGKVLLAEQTKANGNTQINIADLPSGIYLLKIEDKNSLGVYRVVKH